MSTQRKPHLLGYPSLMLMLMLTVCLSPLSLAATKTSLTVSTASWTAKSGQLTVKGSYNGSEVLELYDSTGRYLGKTSAEKNKYQFQLPDSQPGQLCGVHVKAGTLASAKTITGNNSAICFNMPECQITAPANGTSVALGELVAFSATATPKDKKAGALRYEWDFGGGAMGQEDTSAKPTAYLRPTTLNTSTRFVRDNSVYRVRFSAYSPTDQKQRYCEDSILVTVGKPPTGLPDMSALVTQAQNKAPAQASQLAGKQGDIVVLPFPNLTFQNNLDSRTVQNIHSPAPLGPLTSISAQVYKKDRLPPQLTTGEVKLKYSAASNPHDPTGAGSINSTSQNWPLNTDIRKPAALASATIPKTDMWEYVTRLPSEIVQPPTFAYYAANWLATVTPGSTTKAIGTDEGIIVGKNFGSSANTFWGGNPPWKYATPTLVADDHGRYMPGHDAPYNANAQQDFTAYLNDPRWFTARNIPVTDIDDSGRVNPFPLMRVEAQDKTTGQPLAATDAVVSAGTDFHCRECHAKGKIAANDKFDWASVKQAWHTTWEYGVACDPSAPLVEGQIACNAFTPPVFFDAVDRNGQPSQNIADQEFAAIKNANVMHDFYDGVTLNARLGGTKINGVYYIDSPSSCTNCHQSLLQAELGAQDINNGKGEKYGDEDFWPRESPTMHRFHGELQLDPADPTKILRGSDGRPLRWDPAKGPNPNTLFPTVDSKGNSLPQEQSCLHCHAGHRDQLYRDRMYTAGTTCYDCHGDMLAVGMAYNKPKLGPEGFSTRLDWYEQPDCGSCHTGDANRGKEGTNGYFSAGVLKRAFAASDRSATTLTPVTQRFAVQATKPVDAFYTDWLDWNETHGKRSSILSMSSPLYRNSKDTHGDVACGACHGGAHEVWPNRNPNANDNVTAMQMQGHTGTILECNVCHTADAFKNEADLDGGIYSGDTVAGILGGPHNTHPINDPYWWKSTTGDSANTDGTTYGGWHNNYAKKSGKEGEDQCAACHGNDHKGTRLSRTPVARVFDFSSFNQTKLKKAGFKAKIVKVPAGTFIGCDTCHSIKTSCIGSPAGTQCGVAATTIAAADNHDPVITSTATVTTAIMGQAYSYKVTATDADGDPLTYGLGLKPGSMSIDPQSGVVTTNWPVDTFSGYRQGPFIFPFSVNVKDGKGGYATQNITLTLRCPDGQYWDFTSKGVCVANNGVTISSQAPRGVTAGDTYSYQVAATSAKGLPLTYSVINVVGPRPTGALTIDAKTGLLTFPTSPFGTLNGTRAFRFTVKATDGQGTVTQTTAGVICKSPKTWNNNQGKCVSP